LLYFVIEPSKNMDTIAISKLQSISGTCGQPLSTTHIIIYFFIMCGLCFLSYLLQRNRLIYNPELARRNRRQVNWVKYFLKLFKIFSEYFFLVDFSNQNNILYFIISYSFNSIHIHISYKFINYINLNCKLVIHLNIKFGE